MRPISFYVSFIVIVLLIVWVSAMQPKDSTDPPNGRSGLKIYVDAMTGCEYLSASLFGAITPRMNELGEHICRGVER